MPMYQVTMVWTVIARSAQEGIDGIANAVASDGRVRAELVDSEAEREDDLDDATADQMCETCGAAVSDCECSVDD